MHEVTRPEPHPHPRNTSAGTLEPFQSNSTPPTPAQRSKEAFSTSEAIVAVAAFYLFAAIACSVRTFSHTKGKRNEKNRMKDAVSLSVCLGLAPFLSPPFLCGSIISVGAAYRRW